MNMDSIDLFDPDIQENWFPTYKTLLEEAPVYRIPGSTTFVITKYEDILTIVSDPKTFSNEPEKYGGEPLIVHPEARQYYIDHGLGKQTGRTRWPLLGMDPPDHGKYRKLIDRHLMDRQVLRRTQPFIEETITELIDEFEASGSIEFVKEFAIPLPVKIITAMIGFPLEDIPQLKIWSTTWTLPFARGLSLAQEMEVARQGVDFQNYIRDIANERRKRPKDDVITHLVQAKFDEKRPLTDHEIASIVDNMYIGGNETTTFTLTSGMWLMLKDPSIYQALKKDKSKIQNFTNEVLRLESPTQGLYRTAVIDTEIRGMPIPKGSTIHIRFGAANRDEEVFSCPEKLDLNRANCSRHLAFSRGEHGCPGSSLARMELNIAYEHLIKRLSGLQLTPKQNDFTHHPGFILRGLKELYLSFEPRSGKV